MGTLRMPSVVVVKKRPRLTGYAALRQQFDEWKKKKERDEAKAYDNNIKR